MPNESNWVEEFLARLEAATDGILNVEIGGQKIVAQIGKDLIQFFKTNKQILIRVGKSTFRSFLLLISEKKDEQAFNLLLGKMEAEDIILRMEQNAEILKEYNDNRHAFYEAMKKFTLGTLLPATAKVLFVLLF